MARTGSRPRAFKRAQYDWVYHFTAVRPNPGPAAGLILPHAEAGAADLLLVELSRRLSPDVQAVPIWDGAAYHTSLHMVVPASRSLLPS